MIAAGHQGHAELLFNTHEVLIVLAEQHGQQAIVVELQMHGLRGGRGGRHGRRRPHAVIAASRGALAGCGASALSTTRPARLFGWTDSIATLAISPINPGAVAWTA